METPTLPLLDPTGQSQASPPHSPPAICRNPANAVGSSPALTRNGPGWAPTHQCRYGQQSAGSQPLDNGRVQPAVTELVAENHVGVRPRRQSAVEVENLEAAIDPSRRANSLARRMATGDTSTARTFNPRAASHTDTAPSPQARSRPTPVFGNRRSKVQRHRVVRAAGPSGCGTAHPSETGRSAPSRSHLEVISRPSRHDPGGF